MRVTVEIPDAWRSHYKPGDRVTLDIITATVISTDGAQRDAVANAARDVALEIRCSQSINEDTREAAIMDQVAGYFSRLASLLEAGSNG